MARVTDSYLEERRAEILDAAWRVFVRRGYDSATMQDIAAEADVAAGSIYRYFPGKSDLIAAVLERCCDDDRTLFVAPEDAASPLQALLETGERVRFDLAAEDDRAQCILRLESFLAATRDEPLRETVNRRIEDTQEQLTSMLRTAQEAGELDASIDPADLALALHAFTAGVGTLRVPMGDALDVDRVWAVLLRLFSSLFLVDPTRPADPAQQS